MSSSAPGFFERHHFAIRRLHSLTGIVPVGLFLFNHLLTNSTAFLGPEKFNHHVELIHSLPWLLAIETLFIFLPLLFHGVLGVAIAWQAKPNQNQYPYMDNWRFALQRITAYITIVFVVVHLVHFRFAHWFGIADSYAAAHDMPGGFFLFTVDGFHNGLLGLPVWAWLFVYLIGLLAAVFHFCNGIVTFCITWGLVIGDESRKRVSLAAGGLGALLVVWGVLSLYALGTQPREDAQARPDASVAQQEAQQPPGTS